MRQEVRVEKNQLVSLGHNQQSESNQDRTSLQGKSLMTTEIGSETSSL